MTALLDEVNVPECCLTERCDRDGCSVSLEGCPAPWMVVDVDCEELGISNQKRCDCLFVSDDNERVNVVPIELKAGSFSVSSVLEQLQKGALYADQWLPSINRFQFVPVLVHGKKVHRDDLKRMRRVIRFRGKKARAMLIKCKDPLTRVLPSEEIAS